MATAPPPTEPTPSVSPLGAGVRPTDAAQTSQAAKVAAALSRARAPIAEPARPATPPARQPEPTPQAVATTSGAVWQAFFADWPEGLPKRGIVVTQLNEAVVFQSYMTRGDVVLLQRQTPDAIGARFLILPYGEIAVVKLTDSLKQDTFDTGGFVGSLA